MTDLFERGGHMRLSWQDRFKDKWPYMTTMMYQNDGTNLDALTNGHAGHNGNTGHSVSVENLPRETGWPHHQQDVWSDRRILDHNKLESDVSSSSSKHKKGCYKACNIALCVFLIITIVTAACAGIGLAILLNDTDDNDILDYGDNHKDTHLDGFLSPNEEIYLSKQFCDLMKVLMKSARYPIKDGIDHCYTTMKLIKGSEELHIEMHVQPTARYTMKEKLRRALREQKLAEGSYRINGTNTCIKTTKEFPTGQCSDPVAFTDPNQRMTPDKPVLAMDENFFRKDFQSTKQTPGLQTIQPKNVDTNSELPMNSEFSDLIMESFSSTRLEYTRSVLIEPSSLSIEPSVSIEVTPSSSMHVSLMPTSYVQSYVIETSSMATSTPDLSESYLDSVISSSIPLSSKYVSVSTTLPQDSSQTNQSVFNLNDTLPVLSETQLNIFTSAIQESGSSVTIVGNSTRSSIIIQPSSSSFPSSESSTEILNSGQAGKVHWSEVRKETFSTREDAFSSDVYSQTPSLPSTTDVIMSTSTSIYPFDTLQVSQSSSSGISPSTSIPPENVPSENIPSEAFRPKAFQTVAKTQIQIAPKLSEFHHKGDTSTRSHIETTTPRQTRFVENLMLGGVVKLPFKTTSRFRFLFANSANRQAVSPSIITKQRSRAKRPNLSPVSTTKSYNFNIVKNKGAAKVRFTPSTTYKGQSLVRDRIPSVLRQQSAFTRNKTPPPIFGGRNSQTLARSFGDNYINDLQRQSG